MSTDAIAAFVERNAVDIDTALNSVIDRVDPARLYEPSKYILEGKGKRFRPQLVLAAADAFQGNRAVALQAAAAVEVFHIFTLVHDDIMDRSPSRRGRETIHVKWDEPTAILTGDYLLGRTMELLLAYPDERLRMALDVFTTTVRLLCEGQVRDMAFEERSEVTLDEYLVMIDQKTSALLECSLMLGGLSGNASSEDVDVLKSVGHHIGRAFQIQDDLLDVTSESAQWGKPIGGDLMSAKKTFMLLHALGAEQSTTDSWFADMVSRGGATPEEIPEARARMDQLGVIETAREAVIFHSEEALRLMAGLPASVGRESMQFLTRRMQQRLH